MIGYFGSLTDGSLCSYAGVDAAASEMAAMDVSDQQEPG